MEGNMDIMQLESQLLQEKFGENFDAETIQNTVSDLFVGQAGQIDLGEGTYTTQGGTEQSPSISKSSDLFGVGMAKKFF
jgi:hypothetical protein